VASVNLEDNEWNYVLSVLGDKPWREVNMLVLKIGSQLQAARREHASTGLSEQSYPRANPSRLPPEITPANSRHSPEQRETRQSAREESGSGIEPEGLSPSGKTWKDR
jgi:hypothetical protein